MAEESERTVRLWPRASALMQRYRENLRVPLPQPGRHARWFVDLADALDRQSGGLRSPVARRSTGRPCKGRGNPRCPEGTLTVVYNRTYRTFFHGQERVLT